MKMEDEALDQVYPLLQEWLDNSGTENYVDAPIISDQAWDRFHVELEEYSGLSQPDIISKMGSPPLGSKLR